MSKRVDGITEAQSGFTERWYAAALQNHDAQWERAFEEAFTLPGDVRVFAPAYLFPAVAAAEKALWDFGKSLLTDCIENLRSSVGGADFIRVRLTPRVLEEIRKRKQQIRERPLLTGWRADDIRMLLAATKIDQLENEIRNALEIEAIRREKGTEDVTATAELEANGLPRTWEDLRRRGSIRRKEAAQYLNCSERTVQRRVEKRQLTQSIKGRISCDDHLKIEIRKVHGDHVLR